MDIRRIPNEDDLQFLDWIVHSQKAMILVLDKSGQSESRKNGRQIQKKILEALGAGNIHYVYYSATKNQGRRELMAMIRDAISEEPNLKQRLEE